MKAFSKFEAVNVCDIRNSYREQTFHLQNSGYDQKQSHQFSTKYPRPGLLKLWVAKCNFGVTKQIGLTNQTKAFANLTRKLKVGLQWIYFFCIFTGNNVLHAVSCSLRYLPKLSNDNNQPNTTSHAMLHHDCFKVLTNIELTALIPTRRHACV